MEREEGEGTKENVLKPHAKFLDPQLPMNVSSKGK